MKEELEKFQRILSRDYPACLEGQCEDEEMKRIETGEEEEKRRSSEEAFLKITLQFMRGMKQEELADSLQKSKFFVTIAEKQQ